MTGLGIYLEYDDIVRTLIGGKKILTGWINPNVSWRFSKRRNAFTEAQRAVHRVDRVNYDAVIAAIGDVEKPARSVDLDLGGGVPAIETDRKS